MKTSGIIKPAVKMLSVFLIAFLGFWILDIVTDKLFENTMLWDDCDGAEIKGTVKNGTLTISGSGTIGCGKYKLLDIFEAYTGNTITDVVIEEGITFINKNTFYNSTRLKSVTLPGSLTAIGSDAFAGCTGLTSVTIPFGVKVIGESAFAGCSSLTSITIPTSVTEIGEWAFARCISLKSVDIPSSVERIGQVAFDGSTGLESITIPNSVRYIGSSLFRGCAGLKYVTIGSGADITANAGYSWWGYMFKGCTSLVSINVSENNPWQSSEDGVLFNRHKTELLIYPQGKRDSSYTVPGSVKSIGYKAFFGASGLKSLTISDSANKIAPLAFFGCTGLTSVNIPNGIIKIEPGTFQGCTSLSSVTLPNSLTVIGGGKFSTFGSNLDYGGAFENCTNLTSITIPGNVTQIERRAFYGCSSLNSVTVLNPVPPNMTDASSSKGNWGSMLHRDDMAFPMYVFDSAVLYVPPNSIGRYRSAWGEIKDKRPGFRQIKPHKTVQL